MVHRQDPVGATIAELVATAAACGSRREFHYEALRAIARTVGFDTAFVARFDVREPDGPTIVGFDALPYDTYHERRATYAADLAPLFHAAELARGVAQDLDVYAAHDLDRLPVYAECIRPSQTCVVIASATLRVAGRPPAVLQLGRANRGARFSARELDAVRALLPAFALGDALHRAPRPRPVALASITPREAEVLEYAALALTTAQIARVCGTSPWTVKNQLASLCRKLGATSRAELVRIALLESAATP